MVSLDLDKDLLSFLLRRAEFDARVSTQQQQQQQQQPPDRDSYLFFGIPLSSEECHQRWRRGFFYFLIITLH